MELSKKRNYLKLLIRRLPKIKRGLQEKGFGKCKDLVRSVLDRSGKKDGMEGLF
jgi:hypothetical protein